MKPTPTASSSQDFYTVAANYRAAGRTADRLAVGGEADGGFAARPPAASYLEQDRNTVTVHQCEPRYELKPHGCGSWFCPHCCKSKGIKLKHKLIPALARFKKPMMLTFTIDPELFASPREAFEYVKKHRCIGVTVQRLKRWKLVNSDRYFAVVEWQANGWPHWHVAVDSDFIEFGGRRDKSTGQFVLTEPINGKHLIGAWNRNMEGWRERMAAGRPGFGSVSFSRGITQSKLNAKGAAGYLSKYLIKFPAAGYPEWVHASKSKNVHRYSTSRGFWPDATTPAAVDESKSDASDDADGAADPCEETEAPERKRRTIGEQVAKCGMESTDMFKVIDQVDAATGERLKPLYSFICRIKEPLADLLAANPCLRLEDDGRSISMSAEYYLHRWHGNPIEGKLN